jgi:uncharacterized protein
MQYIPYGKPFKNSIGKIFGLFQFDTHLFKISRKFNPDLFFSHGSIYSSHVAFLMHRPFITFEDTGNMEQILLYKPFSKVILTPHSFKRNLGKKQIRFNGSKELAYLHPNYFKPDPNVLYELGVQPDEKYVLLRFVSWNASHDIGHKGITYKNKIAAIIEISKYAKVFISSEAELPADLKKFQIKISPEKILDVMYFAQLLYGESATMASECAVMGTPAIFINNASISYTKEQEEKYSLVYNFSESKEDQIQALNLAIDLIRTPDIKNIWRVKSKKMIEDQIDLTAFMIWFVTNYPSSIEKLKKEPGFSKTFIQ